MGKRGNLAETALLEKAEVRREMFLKKKFQKPLYGMGWTTHCTLKLSAFLWNECKIEQTLKVKRKYMKKIIEILNYEDPCDHAIDVLRNSNKDAPYAMANISKDILTRKERDDRIGAMMPILSSDCSSEEKNFFAFNPVRFSFSR